MLRPEEIERSILEAAKGKTKRRNVRKVLDHLHETALDIRQEILNGEWRPLQHEQVNIQEGSHRKKRNIVKPAWRKEQIVHHMLARQLAKIYGPRTYFYVAGTIKPPGVPKGKGPLFCVRTVRRWRNEYHGRKFYVAELDVAKFFDNVDIPALEAILSMRIRDKRYLRMLFEVMESAGPGIPKGYYTSPWLAQIYLEGMDNFILQELKPDHYLRFVDNLIILHRNKRELHKMIARLEEYIWDKLKLRFNSSKQIYRFEYEDKAGHVRGRAINCTGYAIHRNRVAMRKSILKRARAKALRMRRKGRYTARDARAMLSYKGWLRQTDTYRYFKKWIAPNVSFRDCRRKVSEEAKRRDRLENRSGNARPQAAGAGRFIQRVHGVPAQEYPARGDRRRLRREARVGIR